MPVYGGIERTSTVVIGTGLSGLAVASELQRRGVDAIVVDGLDLLGAGNPANTSSLQRCDAADAATLRERNEILRHLRNYAISHKLDIRNDVRALQLDHLDADGFGVEGLGGACDDVPAGAHRRQPWAVSTPSGILYADHLVLTRCAHSQLRRMLAELGVAAGQNLMAAMHALGMYLVGVGELITPTPKEVLRQAKLVGQAISAKVNPEGMPSLLSGGLALPA
ncbi:FAD-binding protein [Arthrobacter sp. UKPF54-2]|uniref:FAD-binding protein n=1 Tax=Arthrobacter sp. UKPF54-2 TaxID=2600159 RepID=UPI0011B103BE|nr:FAD-binding protein [Arthrobacter sp. UKPF54-2]QDY91662.1 FAD-binding protein [Arthrobacter sp. UKPF54-2]